ncbi:MAG: ECF transporter S component [Eubacterium sp.]|nr:ECF transporter S component [Eubacterium sp.]
MKKVFPFLYIVLSLAVAVVWQILSYSVNYYLVSVLILIISMLPFFFSFERSKPTAREIALISSLIAIAALSRAVFYLIPQVKPIGAVVIVSGVCLGAKRGYLIGAFSAFISNFIFGQGIWTPFQMAALGMVGFAAGIIFSTLKVKRVTLSLIGFVLTFALYGFIADLSSVLILSADFTLPSMLAVYGAALPFNLVFAVTTGVTLFFLGKPFINKINRLQIKYGIYSEELV